MAAHNDLGKWGEEMAARYLMDNGYAILERDWRYQRRDLDIIDADPRATVANEFSLVERI